MAEEDGHRLIVEGADICGEFGLVMLDSSTFEPPEPKTYTVDIPGGNGVIDLTEALSGDVAYKRRKQRMEFACEERGDWMDTLRRVMAKLHGRALAYRLSFDPGYTYHGRFAVSSTTHVGRWGDSVGHIVIEVDADPYKSKGTQAYRLNATGGKLYRFESGRRMVRPTIECSQPCFITWDGEETAIPAGTWRLNDVAFSQGFNEIWINTRRVYDVAWEEVAEGGNLARTWDSLSGMRWDEVQMLGQDPGAVVRSWDDLTGTRWEDMAEGGDAPRRWRDLNYARNAAGDSTAYLEYEWEDL